MCVRMCASVLRVCVRAPARSLSISLKRIFSFLLLFCCWSFVFPLLCSYINIVKTFVQAFLGRLHGGGELNSSRQNEIVGALEIVLDCSNQVIHIDANIDENCCRINIALVWRGGKRSHERVSRASGFAMWVICYKKKLASTRSRTI